MRIAFNPINNKFTFSSQYKNDLVFDLQSRSIYAKGVQLYTRTTPENPEITFSPTEISLTTEWSRHGFILSSDKFSNGLYAIKITKDSLIFSGIVSVYVGKITVEDEIILHMSGIPKIYDGESQGRIYAKIAPSQTADYGEIYLATDVPESAITNLSITMKKII